MGELLGIFLSSLVGFLVATAALFQATAIEDEHLETPVSS